MVDIQKKHALGTVCYHRYSQTTFNIKNPGSDLKMTVAGVGVFLAKIVGVEKRTFFQILNLMTRDAIVWFARPSVWFVNYAELHP